MGFNVLRPRSVLSDTDFFANLTGSAAPYSYGLTGVNQVANYLYVNIIVVFFLGLCFITFVLRLSRMGNAHLRHMFVLGNPNQAYWAQNKSSWLPWLKRNVVYAPLWKVRHNREIQLSAAVNVGTLPSRFHTLLLSVYLLSNIAYCLVLDWSKGNVAEVTAEFRGRTGVLAAINLIPTILFALRNNPLIPLLQVSYDTFNLLHRWTARVMIVEAVAHTFAWLVNTIRAGEANGGLGHVAEVLEQSPSYRWGMVGTSVFVFISLQAWSPIRHAFYETFLNIHRLMVVLGLAAVYLHLDLDNLPHLPYVQFVICLWALEWFVRAARIIYYNASGREVTKITVQALPSEACRVTFDLVRPWAFRPGCHVHAYLPTVALWSSHPFSVAWTEARSATPESEKLPTNNVELSRVPKPSRTAVSLVMRARTGMTRTLFNKASAAPNGTFTTWGAIEGPYGGHESFSSYGTLVLFAGGVGITHQVGFVRDLVAGYQAGTVAARRVVLVWSVANTEALEWVRPWMDEILRMPARREVLRVLLFVTKPKSQAELVSGTGTVQMFPGRCDPQLVLDREIAARIGAMAVTVCGPGAFADSVRAAVRDRVHLGNIDFVEEAFTY